MPGETLLGRAIYDLHELSRIVRRRAGEIDGWSQASRGQEAILRPRGNSIYSFHDLITAALVAELRRGARDVALSDIRGARTFLADQLKTCYPFAHAHCLNRLATVGRSLYWDSDGQGDWLDVGRGGQAPIRPLIDPLLRAVEFGADDLASRWEPAGGVVLDPRIQAGAPCVQGTRVPTLTLVDLVDAGEDVADLAEDYDLSVELVRAAVSWERHLAPVA